MSPTDSSSGVDCALPTTNSPARSTMNVSVIVPPASIARTRGAGAWAAAPADTALPEPDLLGLLLDTAPPSGRSARLGPAHDVPGDDHVVHRPVLLVPQRPRV